MTPGWQSLVYGAALVLFVLAALAAWAGHGSVIELLIALGLALVTLVPLWAAAALD